MALSGKNIRFCNNNYADGATVTTSSEQTSLEASNAAKEERWKIWSPSGHFEITSSNNSIYINDGSDKTVTITTGDYTTPESLASEMATQLNASSSGWIVSYGGDKFTIQRTSSATVRFSQTTNALWDTIGFTGSTDLTDTGWQADEQRNHTEEYITFDMGTSLLPTFFAAIGPIDEVFSLSSTGTIKLQANSVDSWSSPPIDITLTVNDTGIMRFLDDDVSVGYRFWRLYFQDKYNTVGATGFKLAHIYIGDHLTLTSSNVARGFQRTWQDLSSIVVSKSGTKFFDIQPKRAVWTGLRCQFITNVDMPDLEQFAFDYARSKPFYLSIDPGLDVSTDVEDLTRYMYFRSEPQFEHIKTSVYSMSFSVEEVI